MSKKEARKAKAEIRFIFPPTAESTVELALVELTKHICRKTGGSGTYGFFGGPYGYGEDYENDVFMMHVNCWCGKCKWCRGGRPNFLYKPSGTSIVWYKWIGRDQEQTGELPKDWFEKCVDSLKSKE